MLKYATTQQREECEAHVDNISGTVNLITLENDSSHLVSVQ